MAARSGLRQPCSGHSDCRDDNPAGSVGEYVQQARLAEWTPGPMHKLRFMDVPQIQRTTATMLLLLTFAVAHADERAERRSMGDRKPATAVSRLTIDAAVSHALGTHPGLRAAEAAVRRQSHLVYQSTRKPNPTVGYMASEVGNDGEAGQQGVFLSQNFVRGCKLDLDGRIREGDVSVAARQQELRRQQIEADVRLLYLEAVVAQERRRLLRKLQMSFDRAQTSARRLLESGIISRSSLSQAMLEAQKNAMQIRQTETELKVSSAGLAALTGHTQSDWELDAAILLPETKVPGLEELWKQIQADSPELQIASSAYARSHWRVRREIAEPIPDLQTQWSLQQDASTNHTVLGIQIGVELPIRDTNAGAVRAARSDTWRSHYEIEALRRTLRQRVTLAHGQLLQADQQLQFIREKLQNLAQDNLQKTLQAFSLGEATYLDLLNAQRTYISLSLDTLKLYRQRAIAEAHLQTNLVRFTVAGE